MSAYTDVVIYAPFMHGTTLITTITEKYPGYFHETEAALDTIIPYTITGSVNHLDRAELLDVIKEGCKAGDYFLPVIVLTNHEYDDDYQAVFHKLSSSGEWS